jgi:hypothetical protein
MVPDPKVVLSELVVIVPLGEVYRLHGKHSLGHLRNRESSQWDRKGIPSAQGFSWFIR